MGERGDQSRSNNTSVGTGAARPAVIVIRHRARGRRPNHTRMYMYSAGRYVAVVLAAGLWATQHTPGTAGAAPASTIGQQQWQQRHAVGRPSGSLSG